jgi:inosine/xanthosine triphosphate pyrophosphatase family protein
MLKVVYYLAKFLRYAEMDKDEKNKISHRFKALEKLKAWLQDTN